jgi:hypothetical protein
VAVTEPAPAIDRRPVLIGAGVAAGIAVAAGIPQRMISTTSSLIFLLLFVILGGMTLGGYVAARPQPEVGLTAGGQAALVGAAAAQLLSLLYALTVGGKSATVGNLVYIVFIVLLSACFGVLGGYYAFRRRGGAGHADASASTGAGESGIDADEEEEDSATWPDSHEAIRNRPRDTKRITFNRTATNGGDPA